MRVTSCPVTESIMMRLLGNTASALTGSIRPSASNIQNTLGPSWMPAPISLDSAACSTSWEGMPLRASAGADDDDLAVLPIAHARDSSTHIVKGEAFTTRLAQSAKSGDECGSLLPPP